MKNSNLTCVGKDGFSFGWEYPTTEKVMHEVLISMEKAGFSMALKQT